MEVIPVNHPEHSDTFKQLDILRRRKFLSASESNLYLYHQNGYDGELQFYNFFNETLNPDVTKLFDLRFKVSESECQIDCLLIFEDQCIVFEIKNYEGNYYIEGNKWYLQNGQEIKNPLDQLNRSEMLLKRLFQQAGVRTHVSSYLVFMNANFTLYQAPKDLKALFLHQLASAVHDWNRIYCGPSQERIAEFLRSRHLPHSSYEAKFNYHYDELEKNLFCKKCLGRMERTVKSYTCPSCGNTESIEDVVLRSVEQIRTLFKDDKITVPLVYDWNGGKISKYHIRSVLARYYPYTGGKKNRIYLVP